MNAVMTFDFIILATLVCVVICLVIGLTYAITVLVWKINMLEETNDSLRKDKFVADNNIAHLRKKLSKERCTRCVGDI